MNAYPKEKVEEALELYKTGLSCEAVGRTLLVGESAIREWVKKAGLLRKSKYYNRWPQKMKDEAVELYRSGLNVMAVARELKGPHGVTVSSWVKQEGIKIRATVGENSPLWKRGKSKWVKYTKAQRRLLPEIRAEVREWRMAIFKRDDFRCVCCHKTGGNLMAHHILGWAKYPKYRFDVSNGTTLCRDCHLYIVHGWKKKEVG